MEMIQIGMIVYRALWFKVALLKGQMTTVNLSMEIAVKVRTEQSMETFWL